MRISLFVIVLLLSLEHPLYSRAHTPDSVNIGQVLDVFYTEGEDTLQSLDVYWNRNSKNASVLMFVHGGGLLSGDKKQYREMAFHLAKNGMTVVLVNYRLSPTVKFPAHVEDVATAIYWARCFIKEYNGDSNSIYLMGHSAGGYLISLILCDKHYLEEYGMVPNDISGVVVLSGVFEIKSQDGGATKAYLGMTFGDDERIWENASCKTHIDTTTKNNIPPFLISWGAGEGRLIINESKNFTDILNNTGVTFQTFIFNDRNHYAFKSDLMNSESEFFKRINFFMTNP